MLFPVEVWVVLLGLAALACVFCFVLSLVNAAFSLPRWLHWAILSVYGVVLFLLVRGA